ncbi:MAG: Gfo/Idh/MocA family oxidoreductase [Candidatus Latescibacteria bacterium]|nr:Gfo/Idh/MocA family oxidoreductase [Candidatus Latescibacterota bacterium]
MVFVQCPFQRIVDDVFPISRLYKNLLTLPVSFRRDAPPGHLYRFTQRRTSMATKSSNPLNVGVIGVGLLGGRHARYASTHPDARLRAVADPRPQAGRAVASETGATWYDDYRVMLRKEDLDLVIVATPDPFHRDPIVAAAQAGVPNLLTEKPMATTLADARRMRDAVDKAGAALYILFPNRFSPLDRAVRYAVRHGLLGRPAYGDVRLDDNISVPTAMWGGRSRDWASGSSTAHFLLSHVVDLLRWYFHPADVVEVCAASQRRVLRYTPDLYDAQLFFDTGLLVRVKAEWIRRMDALVEFDLSFSGDRGGLVYRKTPAFRARQGLRIDPEGVSSAELERHQKALAR